MCGIVGIVHLGTRGDAPKRVRAMAKALAHRGPDDDGFWADADVAFGFRRLAIVDLTTGAQPMTNENATVHVIFNGEIYNHRELRQQLEARGHVFRTDHSDTETLVHGYEEWGPAIVDRLNGMFAFAAWDAPRRRLFLARDRLGIKPLYISERGRELIFASEVRALHASGLVEKRPDATGVFEYFQQQNVWGGRSMFAGVRMLEPGTFLELTPEGRREERFWDIRFSRQEKTLKKAAENLRAALGDALKRQLAADVPIMTYLSGGIDSSGYHRARTPGGPGCQGLLVSLRSGRRRRGPNCRRTGILARRCTAAWHRAG